MWNIPDSVTKNTRICVLSVRKNLVNVILSKNLEKIDCNAFGNCDGLTQIEIPKSLDIGGDYYSGAFADCANLKKVTFERGTTKIASSLLCGCTGIEKIDIPDTVTVFRDYAFSNAKT